MARPSHLNLSPAIPGHHPVPVFSPALPSAIHQGFHPHFPPAHTPMQPFFGLNPPPNQLPRRPTHHVGSASVSHFPPGPIHPQNGFPAPPSAGHFSRPSLMLGPGQLPPFPHRNRRQPSIGGPPKAVLGGPARKSPIPPTAVPPPPPSAKVKKAPVNLPKETILDDTQHTPTRPPWARTPVPTRPGENEPIVPPPQLTTGEIFPPESWTRNIPEMIDVFLPGKAVWEEMRQQAMEEKLEKLGVERGSGSNIPHIHAPRAASISTVADPNLLLLKLNQLQRSREGSAANSLSASPQPLFGLSPSPISSTSGFTFPRHNHTQSLAHPPTFVRTPFEEGASSNPFGHDAVLGNDHPLQPASPYLLGSVPSSLIRRNSAPLDPPLSAVLPSESRPDFVRGFGLDIPEEEEPEEEEEEERPITDADDDQSDGSQDMDVEEDGDKSHHSYSIRASPFQSRHHSRHESKLSAHLSLGSFGGNDLAPSILHKSIDGSELMHPENELSHVAGSDVDAAREWTGTDSSDEEASIGEWSNPSDEEKARRDRVARRLTRRAAKLNIDEPRRIPNFPSPPARSLSPGGRGEFVSNPSEEQLMLGPQVPYVAVEPTFYSPSRSSQVLPHSRSGSAPYSIHDPARAHSRTPSEEKFVYPGVQHEQQSSLSKRDLNPFAKPFVFGGPLASSSPTRTPQESPHSHDRIPSFGNNKQLNVAAPEFKPGGFTFRPPPGVPQMPVTTPVSAPAFLNPQPRNEEDGSPFPAQGREKRQRRGSTASLEEGESMLSFKFPPRDIDSPQAIQKMKRSTSLSGSHDRHHSQNHIDQLSSAAQPFTFAGFSAVAKFPMVPSVPTKEGTGSPEEVTLRNEGATRAKVNDADVEEDEEEDGEDDDVDDGYTLLPSSKSSSKKRTPQALELENPPLRKNTVPAGLFKALANEDRTRRRTVRSRLGSRELFDHFRGPSMDDNNVPQISHGPQSSLRTTSTAAAVNGAAIGAVVVGNGGMVVKRESISDDDVFGTSYHHSRRRSSLPDHLGDLDDSDLQDSVSPIDLTGKMELHRIERVIGELLDVRFEELKREITSNVGNTSVGNQSLSPSTEARIEDVIALFRTQLQESATRSLEDIQMDARGEMDFHLIKDVVEDGQKELLALVKRELKDAVAFNRPRMENGVIAEKIEAVGNRVIAALRETMLEQEAIKHTANSRERDALSDKLVTALSPVLASTRSEPLDYDFLTSQLAEAVKPHITQIIDLASDKRETASIIVEQLVPLLPQTLLQSHEQQQPPLDTDALTLKLITEVRKAMEPIDPFEIREQVADLVVERLDSKLAVRDKAVYNVEAIGGKVDQVVSSLFDSLKAGLSGKLDGLVEGQNGVRQGQEVVQKNMKDIRETVECLPSQVEWSMDAVLVGQKSVLAKLEDLLSSKAGEKDGEMVEIKSLVDVLVQNQKEILGQDRDFRMVHGDLLAKVEALPDAVNTATTTLQTALSDLIHSRDSAAKDVEELRKANADYQVQIAKARGSHGQVRVEKDMLTEKLAGVESERERLRAQVKDLERAANAKTTDMSTLEARNVELEEALSKALSRLQAADVASQASKEKIVELERSSKELSSKKDDLESKAMTLEMQAQVANNEKEMATRTLESLKKQHDELQSQQSHWEDLRRASEKIDLLTNLIGQADNEELQELRRYRDQSRMLENDHNTLQKRFKELESKLVANERNAATTKQNLMQTQQKSSELERRVREAEAQSEALQTKLDQAEQRHTQLDMDHSLAKLQLEEREAEERASKDRETRLRDMVTGLENKVRTLQTELEKRVTNTYRGPSTNGVSHGPIARPDSRTSTVHDRSATPTRRMSSYASSSVAGTPPGPSVWDSMHAPREPVKHPSLSTVHAPSVRYPTPVGRVTPANMGRAPPKSVTPYRTSLAPPRAPSPAMSVVSNAPTLGEDGWWE